MQFSFIHAADIHLDSPLRGLERYEGAPVEQVRGATRRALENLVQLALDEGVAFVVLAGDVYDGDWKDYNSGLYFAGQMRRLRDAAIDVFIVSGNHDAESRITRELRLPDNVRVFSSKRAETMRIEELSVAVHGQSFARPHITEDLSAGYPDPDAGCLNIGVLHTSADGREEHAPYAPCSVQSLAARGYDYWALGHVHAREVLSEDPWIVFPGNLQGRHIREQGAKGLSLIRVGDGEILDVTHRPVDVLRWTSCGVDVSDSDDTHSALAAVSGALEAALAAADGRLLAARVEVHGATRVHDDVVEMREQLTNQVRELANDIGGGELWIEKVRWRTTPAIDLDEARGGDEIIGGLLRRVDELLADDGALLELVRAELEPVQKALETAGVDAAARLPLDDAELAREILVEARDLLLPRLVDVRESR